MKITIKDEITALEESLDHWYTNLMLSCAGELNWTDIVDELCQCCNLGRNYGGDNNSCNLCPLVSHGFSGENCNGTPWGNVVKKLGTSEETKYVESMCRFLEVVLHYIRGME